MANWAGKPFCSKVAAGSISFYSAHLERGGMKRVPKSTTVAPALMEHLKTGGSR